MREFKIYHPMDDGVMYKLVTTISALDTNWLNEEILNHTAVRALQNDDIIIDDQQQAHILCNGEFKPIDSFQIFKEHDPVDVAQLRLEIAELYVSVAGLNSEISKLAKKRNEVTFQINKLKAKLPQS